MPIINPFSASARQQADPMPVPAPVTIATGLSMLLAPVHDAAQGVGRPFRVIRIRDALEHTGASLGHRPYQFPVHEYAPVADNDARPRVLQVREAPDIHLVAHEFVVRANLAVEKHFAAAQGPARPLPASPGAVKPEQLPDRVDREAPGLHGVTRHVALEVPA